MLYYCCGVHVKILCWEVVRKSVVFLSKIVPMSQKHTLYLFKSYNTTLFKSLNGSLCLYLPFFFFFFLCTKCMCWLVMLCLSHSQSANYPKGSVSVPPGHGCVLQNLCCQCFLLLRSISEILRIYSRCFCLSESLQELQDALRSQPFVMPQRWTVGDKQSS